MTIGHGPNGGPSVGHPLSGRQLLAQIAAEEAAERQAALAAQQAADMERGRVRREALDKLREQQATLVMDYELIRAQMNDWLTKWIALDEAVTNFGQQSLLTQDVLMLNVPSLAKPDQWRQRTFSTTEAALHQRASERAKARRVA